VGEDTVTDISRVVNCLKDSFPVEMDSEKHKTGRTVVRVLENDHLVEGIGKKLLEIHARTYGFVLRYEQNGEPKEDVYFPNDGPAEGGKIVEPVYRNKPVKGDLLQEVTLQPRPMTEEEESLLYGRIQEVDLR